MIACSGRRCMAAGCAQGAEQVSGAPPALTTLALGADSRPSTFRPTSVPCSSKGSICLPASKPLPPLGQAFDKAWDVDHQFARR